MEDIRARDDLIQLLKARVADLESKSGGGVPPDTSVSEPKEKACSLGGGSSRRNVVKPVSGSVSPTLEEGPASAGGQVRRLRLPTLPKFSGEDRDDADALPRWLRKLEKHAEVEQWSKREKLLQFESHLTGRAERTYEVLPREVTESFATAVTALKERLSPVRRKALVSAQLMRRKQRAEECVDVFAHDLEDLFERSYGCRAGMDSDTKELLKRDLFVQGLRLKWQEKVLPSAKTFTDALRQARAAEEQERQLTTLHRPGARPGESSSHTSPKVLQPRKETSESGEAASKSGETGRLEARRPQGGLQCFQCGSNNHKARECPQRKPPSETPGKVRTTSTHLASNSAISTSKPQGIETLEDRCQRLQQEWAEAKFTRLCQVYEAGAEVDQVTGPVGALYYCQVKIEGEPVEALVDTGSAATVLSFDVFKAIGAKAKIPVSALSRPDITLRDYSQRPIPIGAKVNLKFEYQGKSVIAPVYLVSKEGAGSELCLLGTNVVVPLG